MSLDYGMLHVGVRVKLFLAKLNFLTCRCALFNTSNVTNSVILMSSCFARFLRRLFLPIEFTFWMFGRMILDLLPLSVNCDSKSINFSCKNFWTNPFHSNSLAYGIDFSQTDLWHRVASKYWYVSVGFVN